MSSVRGMLRGGQYELGLSEPVGGVGAIPTLQILTDQLTLSQMGVIDYAHHINTSLPPSGFPDLPTALYTMQAHYKSVPRVT